MKKIIALILLAFMTLTFIACSDKTPTNTTSGTDTDTTDVDSGADKNQFSILDLGTYQISEASTGKFLNPGEGNVSIGGGKTVTLGDKDSTFTVCFDELLDKQYCHIYEGEDMKVALRANNKLENGEIRLSDAKDAAEDQMWHLKQNDDGTYTILLYNNVDLCVAMKNGKLVLAKVSDNPQNAKWNLKKVKDGTPCFIQYISEKKNLIVRLPVTVKNHKDINDKLLQDWTNDLQASYESFIELTSFTPYKTIIVKAYEDQEYLGFVMNNDNHIYIQKGFIPSDLDKIAARRKTFKMNDFSFTLLHEMGHMFDFDRGWNFDTEMMTDFKLTYVLDKNNAYGAIAEFGPNKCFNYDTIDQMYLQCGGKIERDGYSIFGTDYLLVKIQKQLGWEPFTKTYAWFQSLTPSEYPATNVDKFKTFIDKISEYSGKDVKSMFTQKQWDTLITYYTAN